MTVYYEIRQNVRLFEFKTFKEKTNKKDKEPLARISQTSLPTSH